MADLFDPGFWVPTIIAVAALVPLYLDLFYKLKSERAANKASADLIGTMREELELLRKQLQEGRLTAVETERAKLLQRRQEQEWKTMKDVFKGLGWLYDRFSVE